MQLLCLETATQNAGTILRPLQVQVFCTAEGNPTSYRTLVQAAAQVESLDPNELVSDIAMINIRRTDVFFSFYLRQRALLLFPAVQAKSGAPSEWQLVTKELGSQTNAAEVQAPRIRDSLR